MYNGRSSIYSVDIIFLNIHSQMKLYHLICKVKKQYIMCLLTKYLTIEFIYHSSRKMILNPLEMKEYHDRNLPSLLRSQYLGLKRKLSYITLLIVLKNNNFPSIYMMKNGVGYNVIKMSYDLNYSYMFTYKIEYNKTLNKKSPI